jgi:hypothetical protein
MEQIKSKIIESLRNKPLQYDELGKECGVKTKIVLVDGEKKQQFSRAILDLIKESKIDIVAGKYTINDKTNTE